MICKQLDLLQMYCRSLTFIERHGKLSISERIMKAYIVDKVPRGNEEQCRLSDLILEYSNADELVVMISDESSHIGQSNLTNER